MKKRDNIINVDLDNNYEFINRYDDNIISDELHNYLINSAMKFRDRDNIVIRIGFNYEVTDDIKKKAINFIKDDIKMGVYMSSKFKLFDFSDVYLFIIGISCIIISIMFSYLGIDVFSEVFVIVGWVCVWELVDNFLFDGSYERKLKRKYNQLSKARIELKK